MNFGKISIERLNKGGFVFCKGATDFKRLLRITEVHCNWTCSRAKKYAQRRKKQHQRKENNKLKKQYTNKDRNK